jgi:hypothetical protein
MSEDERTKRLYSVRQGGQVRGPYSPADLRALVSSGELSPLDSVSPAGAGQWTVAYRVRGLFPAQLAAAIGERVAAGAAVDDLLPRRPQAAPHASAGAPRRATPTSEPQALAASSSGCDAPRSRANWRIRTSAILMFIVGVGLVAVALACLATGKEAAVLPVLALAAPFVLLGAIAWRASRARANPGALSRQLPLWGLLRSPGARAGLGTAVVLIVAVKWWYSPADREQAPEQQPARSASANQVPLSFHDFAERFMNKFQARWLVLVDESTPRERLPQMMTRRAEDSTPPRGSLKVKVFLDSGPSPIHFSVHFERPRSRWTPTAANLESDASLLSKLQVDSLEAEFLRMVEVICDELDK